jgi:hypothetical protein
VARVRVLLFTGSKDESMQLHDTAAATPVHWQPRARTQVADWGRVAVSLPVRGDAADGILANVTFTAGAHSVAVHRIDQQMNAGKVVPSGPGQYGRSVEFPVGSPQAVRAQALMTQMNALLDRSKPAATGEHRTGLDPLTGGAAPLMVARSTPNDGSFRREWHVGPLATAPAGIRDAALAMLVEAERFGLTA